MPWDIKGSITQQHSSSPFLITCESGDLPYGCISGEADWVIDLLSNRILRIFRGSSIEK